MSLLLTKTCEYAILVTIQQGRYFSVNQGSIKIEAELDLKLPPSIDDLIPTKTIISSPAAKVDLNGNCTFNCSLVYFVSFKQLQRLRRNDATTTLTIKKVQLPNEQPTDNNKVNNSKLCFSISEAKEVIPQSEHKLDHIYKFVSDKGAWCNIPKSRQQLKVGLFYVAMPDNNNTSSSNNSIVNTPSIQLRSPPPTPIMPKRVTATNSNRKKKITSILGTSNNSIISCATSINNTSNSSTTTTSTTTKKKKIISTASTTPPVEDKVKPQRIPLRRTKSSLVDLNIEELADVLKKINIFSSPGSKNEPTVIPPVPPLPPQQSYHQIGKGSSQYTFYFRIMYADHVKQTLLRQSTPTTTTKRISQLKKPFFSYSFLTNYNLSPAASYNLPNHHDGKSCFQLRGHLVDIQNWLDAQRYIELSYIIMDKYTKETVGKAQVPLQGIAFDYQKGGRVMSDKLYPVYSNDTEEMIAKVTVRIGLVSGWHKDEEYVDNQIADDSSKRRPIQPTALLTALQQQQDDPWDIFHNKKMRHHSQSSVPTLLTSSTTSSTKSSTAVPSIQYIQQRPSLKKSKYLTTTSSFSFNSSHNK